MGNKMIVDMTEPKKIAAMIREILYALSLKKPTYEDNYTMLLRYDDRMNIRKEGEPWNVVDRTMFTPSVIHAASIKLKARLSALI
jgi:hypothetical protein